MSESNKIYEFFKNHIKMAMYGMRCEIWTNLELPLDNQDKIAEELKPVLEEVKKIDDIVEKIINQVSAMEVPAEADFKMGVFDEFRRKIDAVILESRSSIDAIMSSQTVTQRLLTVAMRRQHETERVQQIQAAKQALDPANLAGSPESLGGADTVKIVKNEDGSAEVQPVVAPAAQTTEG